MKRLQDIFETPECYGRGLDWSLFNVHDVADVLRRYLNQLPEPVVPLSLYEEFREPMCHDGSSLEAVSERKAAVANVADKASLRILAYQKLIQQLPPSNRDLLRYILNLLAIFASKSDHNRMTAANLAAAFQPSLLHHPMHEKVIHEYTKSQDVVVFLIQNQNLLPYS